MSDNIVLCFQCNRCFDDSCGERNSDGIWTCEYCEPRKSPCRLISTALLIGLIGGFIFAVTVTFLVMK